MPEQTVVAFLAEYRAARATDNLDRQLEIKLAARDIDTTNPNGPRLMDELRRIDNAA